MDRDRRGAGARKIERQITAGTLSQWLRGSGALPRGSVSDVHIDRELQTTVSRLVFLAVTYSPDAQPELPRHLVVKSSAPPPGALHRSTSEIEFYRSVAPRLASPPLVRCLAAIEDSEDILVLEDLRMTHRGLSWPMVPSRAQAQRAVDAFAQIHARWWEAPALGHGVGEFHTKESLTRMVNGFAAHVPAFFDALGDAATPAARQIVARVFASPLRPWLRLTQPRALTVVHGDAHAGNLLFPRAGDGPAYLVDWQLWHLDVGVRDLAFLIGLHWSVDDRREVERPLLRHYHECLLAHGVSGYTFDELWLDYRRCVVRNLTTPLLFWRRGIKRADWPRLLHAAVSAYGDLECDEIL